MNNATKTRNPTGRPAKYPWQRWLSGNRYSVVRGEDFDCEAYALVLQLRRRASLAGKRIEASITGDIVYFRALEKTCHN
jgi:hypothetical protein